MSVKLSFAFIFSENESSIKSMGIELRNGDAILRTLQILLLGQLISFFLAVVRFNATLVANLGVDTPLTLSFFTYLTLALVYGSILLYRRHKLLIPWYWYLLLAIADVQGNYLVNKACKYTSITSVTILDCWTIAWVIIITWLFLGARYSLWQFFGAAICLLGLGLVLISDVGAGGGGGTKLLLGDILVIAGTFFYAMSNVGEEFCVKNKDWVEVVSMMSVFGILVSLCEIAIFERKSLESVKWSPETILAFAGFALGGFMFYSLVPSFLKMSGATLLNLSLLTSDMWAVVIRIFFYHQQVNWLYYLAFATVVIGLLIYSKIEKDPISIQSPDNGDLDEQYQLIHEESADSTGETASHEVQRNLL